MPFDVTVVGECTITLVELKTIDRAVDWEKAGVVWSLNDGSSRTAMLQRLVRMVREELRDKSREWLRTIEACLKPTARTLTVASYVKLIALRGLQHMHILLRQKLASSAPVERLILRNRPRQLFAAHPPVAPPRFA